VSRIRGLLGRLVIPALAVVTAFFAGALLLVLTDIDHLRLLGSDPAAAIGGAIDVVLRGYGAMLTGALGDPGRIAAALRSGSERDIASAIRPITEALLFATPIIFVTLGIGLALHARLYNFGGNGQFGIGAFGAVYAASVLTGTLPPFAVLVVAITAGTLFGAAYGFLPGILKARTGAHEVITTLMLNAIAFQALIFIGRSGVVPFVTDLPRVPRLFDIETIRLDWGLVAAIVTAGAVWFLLFRTPLGFELRATGYSRTAARSAGMRPGRVTVLAMSMSGGIVGMGGAFLSLGPAGGMSGTGAGLTALALALIAGLRPGGIVLVCVLYGLLNAGAKTMVVETGTPLDMLDVVIAMVLMFVAAPAAIRSLWRLKPARAGGDDPGAFRPAADVAPL
jgi:simple sugar transport system permease protein